MSPPRPLPPSLSLPRAAAMSVLGAALVVAGLLIAGALALCARQPTIRVAGASSERTIPPDTYGRRQVEAAACRWLLGWSNSNAYNFAPHAATALGEVDAALAGRLRAYFGEQARVFDALDRTTSARIAAISAAALGGGLWEVSYTLSEHDFYGPIDTGDHQVSGRLVLSTEHAAAVPALIVAFQPAS